MNKTLFNLSSQHKSSLQLSKNCRYLHIAYALLNIWIYPYQHKIVLYLLDVSGIFHTLFAILHCLVLANSNEFDNETKQRQIIVDLIFDRPKQCIVWIKIDRFYRNHVETNPTVFCGRPTSEFCLYKMWENMCLKMLYLFLKQFKFTHFNIMALYGRRKSIDTGVE